MLEPLLRREAANAIDDCCGRPGPRHVMHRGCEQLLRLWSRAARCLKHWWRVTSNRDYLQSGISRRPAWKLLFPVVSVMNLLLDLTLILRSEGRPWLLLADLPLALAGCLYAVLPSIGAGSLMVDGVLALTSTAVYSLTTVYSSDFDGDATPSDVASSEAWLPAFLVCIAFAGFHSLVVLWLWVLNTAAILAFPKYPVELQWQLILSMGVTCIGAVAMEYNIANLYSQWQLQLRCNQRLLDGASDGFGTVSAVDGTVLAASPKMVETLGDRSLVGKPLQSGVLDPRDRPALASFFGIAREGPIPSAVLVTWSSGSSECELRMVPYELQDSTIGFCVQRVGEVRSRGREAEQHQGQAEPPSPSTVSRHQPDGIARPGLLLPPPALPDAAARVLSDEPAEAGDSFADRERPPAVNEDRGMTLSQSLARGNLTALRELLERPAKTRGTLSLSSWTVSQESTHATGRKPKVETRTLGVQVGCVATNATVSTPPAPMAASSASQHAQGAARQRKHAKKVHKAVVLQGVAHQRQFAPTPRSSCGNALRELVNHLNVGGRGCCAYHIAWRGMHRLLTDELYMPCHSPLAICKDWQCPECFALNNFGTFPHLEDDEEDAEGMGSLQVCAVCLNLVEPTEPLQDADPASRTDSILFGTSDVECSPTASQSGTSPSASSSCSEGTFTTQLQL